MDQDTLSGRGRAACKRWFKLNIHTFKSHLQIPFKFKFKFKQIWVYGDSYQSKLVAVVHPKPAALKAWAKDNGHEGEQLWGDKRADGEGGVVAGSGPRDAGRNRQLHARTAL